MMLTIGAILFGTTQLVPQLLQSVYQYSATLSGLALMPGGVAMLMLMPVVGLLGAHVPLKYLIAFGMGSVGLAMLYMTALSGPADFSFYAWARVYQTIGLPFVFIPITSASYSGLPPEKTSEASSLINVARNLGGSIGISVATTIVARSMQVHQNYLVDHLVPSSSAYQSAMARAASSLTALGVPRPTPPWPPSPMSARWSSSRRRSSPISMCSAISRWSR
jgi:MFS transporter, DHA2 family, multidrug resistance protein